MGGQLCPREPNRRACVVSSRREPPSFSALRFSPGRFPADAPRDGLPHRKKIYALRPFAIQRVVMLPNMLVENAYVPSFRLVEHTPLSRSLWSTGNAPNRSEVYITS